MSQSVTTGTPAQITHVTIVDGQPTTTTHDIAIAFGKRHDHVLRTVHARMADAGEWGLLNFKDTPHTDSQNGQTYPVIRMTEKGFMFVVQKFTGKKAVAVQIQYVDEFERMRNALNAKAHPQVAPPPPPKRNVIRCKVESVAVIMRLTSGGVGFGIRLQGDHYNMHRFTPGEAIELEYAQGATPLADLPIGVNRIAQPGRKAAQV